MLLPDGKSLALISPLHAEGVVAPIYTSRQAAETAAAYYPELGNFAPYPMLPLWEAAQLLAAQGFAGLLVDEQLPIFFVTTAPNSDLPTHVALPQGDDFLILDEAGVTPLGRADVVVWKDLDAFDRQSIRWMLRDRLPFLGYEEDMPLWEFLDNGEPQPLIEQPVLIEAKGEPGAAMLLFSDDFAAEWYWQSVADPSLGDRDEGDIVAHDDIVSLLEARAQPGLALLLNPGRHRFYQGFFRKAGDTWYLVTINGVWRIEPPFRCTQLARRRL